MPTTTAATPDTVLENSRNFFDRNDLQELAEALPESMQLDDAAQAALEAASEHGFEPFFVFPAVSDQQFAWEELLDRLGTQPSDKLIGEQQYGEAPWVHNADAWSNAETSGRPDGAYLMLFREGPMPRETLDLTAARVEKLFASQETQGLSITEYLVLQRIFAERHGDHGFDDYATGWQWLPSTKVDGKCAMAHWHAKPRRLNLGDCSGSSRNKKKGAYPCVIVPLG